MKRTKIICTIGPASEKPKTLEAMMKAGMNVARLNMSHGDYKWHAQAIKAIRQAAKKLDEPVALLLDLQGPKIRIGELGISPPSVTWRSGYELKVGERVIFTVASRGRTSGDARGSTSALAKIPIDYPNLHKEIKKGHRILIADGVMECVVKAVKGKDIYAQVVTGGMLVSHKGLNFPDTKIGLKALTEKDKRDLVFGVKQGVDFVAFSFARTAKDVLELRRLIDHAQMSLRSPHSARGNDHVEVWDRHAPTRVGARDDKDGAIQIIVKIEKQEAVKNFDEILAAADGIMIARGDLALEVSFADVPVIQKEIIEKCRQAAKPVIVATEMLASMEKNPRPTRAEISDVANAVIDHADAVMLSAESAMGKYPVETVATMAKIITETEASRFDDVALNDLSKSAGNQLVSALAAAVGQSSVVKAILVDAPDGKNARLISQARIEKPILASSLSDHVVRQLNLLWGIYPSKSDFDGGRSLTSILKKKFNFKKGDQVVIIAGKQINIEKLR